MFNANNYVVERFVHCTQVNLATDAVDWTARNIQNPNVEFTGESIDKTDERGILLARFDGAKGVNFSGESVLLSTPLMAAQLGSEVEIATEENPLPGETFEILKVVDGAATMTYAPTVVPKYVYAMSADKGIGTRVDVGTETGMAQISGQTITLPADFTGETVGVYYKFSAKSAVRVVDGSENYADAAKYILEVLAADVCNPSIKRHGFIVFPKAKIDNNFSIDLTTEGVHPFSFSALKDYCSEGAELCYLLFAE